MSNPKKRMSSREKNLLYLMPKVILFLSLMKKRNYLNG
jgi:hypothetical protein